jgi:hypothetical protein
VIGPDVFSFAALWRHYRRCRRHKRRSANALAFELDAEANLLALQSELRARTYQPGRSVCFITEGPKPREVFAADFRDRIVHHLPWCSPVLALSLRRQYAALLWHAGEDCLLFFQVGRFIEFYGPQRILAARVLGLGRTRLGRACYALPWGSRTASAAGICAVRSPKGSKSSGSRKCIRRSVRAGRASRRGFTCRESLAPLHGQPPRCHSGRRTGGSVSE